MAEHEIMWIGRKPASQVPAEHPAATEAFAGAMTGACAASGCEVQDYVAAAGAYGSWMIRFRRAGAQSRLVWNGKEGKLVFETAAGPGDWKECRSVGVTQRDVQGFVAGVQAALDAPPA